MALGILKPASGTGAGPGLGIFRSPKGTNPYAEVQRALASTLGQKRTGRR